MDERLRILELIEAGEIGVEEGARRLEALTEATESPDPATASVLASAERPATPVARPTRVQWLWQAAFWTGVGLVAGGGLLLASAYARESAAGWLTWGWLLLILGGLWVLLGWWLQQAPWLFLRVRRPRGPHIAFALPLPLGPAAWVLRIVHPFVPYLEEMGIDELILAIREEMRDGAPLVVEVDEGEGGEQVQICLG